MQKNDWDVVIAHFLGVDHCGHKYGPLHKEMSRKLNEMNTVIERTIEQMDEDTTLYVIGDHGMTITGKIVRNVQCLYVQYKAIIHSQETMVVIQRMN